MALNPFKDGRQKRKRVREQTGLDVGTVVAVSEENHMVAVVEATDTGDRRTDSNPTNASVAVNTRGDTDLPNVGEVVIMARFKARAPIVLGTYYTDKSQIPTFDVGDKILSNGSETANVTINDSGRIDINSDSDSNVYADGTNISQKVSFNRKNITSSSYTASPWESLWVDTSSAGSDVSIELPPDGDTNDGDRVDIIVEDASNDTDGTANTGQSIIGNNATLTTVGEGLAYEFKKSNSTWVVKYN